jgi:hypothetical protein
MAMKLTSMAIRNLRMLIMVPINLALKKLSQAVDN